MHGTLPHKLKEMPADEYMRLISVMNFERQMSAAPPAPAGVPDPSAPLGFVEETMADVISWKTV